MILWGDVPTWVAAVGTVGSLVAGGVLLSQQGRQITDQRRSDSKSQAKLVSAWPVSVTSITQKSAPGKPVERAEITLQNGSDEPIWRCKIWVWSGFTLHPVDRQGALYQLVVPKTLHSVAILFNGEPHSGAELPPVVIMFDDAAGLHWARNAQGQLFRLDDDASIALGVWFDTEPECPYELKCLKIKKRNGTYSLNSGAHRRISERLKGAA